MGKFNKQVTIYVMGIIIGIQFALIAMLAGPNLTVPQILHQLSSSQNKEELKKSLEQIDEYSTYLNQEEFESFSIDSKQEYEGIGVTLLQVLSGIEIREVFKNGPADRAGLQKGDIIIHVDGYDIRNWKFTNVVELLRGAAGSRLSIKVIRNESLMDFHLKRGSVEVPSVENVHMTEDGILYLKIIQFGEKTAKEFLQEVSPYVSKPLTGMIIDLRENTGGILQTSLDILDAFYERGEVMLMTKPRNSQRYKMRRSRFGDPLSDIPTVILINRNTASASEVLAGSLKIAKKAKLIGETTLGKGSIQTVYSLNDGDAYKKTTSYYYLPDGSSIHKKGIDPDIPVEINKQQYIDYLVREQSDIAPYETPEDLYWKTALAQIRKH